MLYLYGATMRERLSNDRESISRDIQVFGYKMKQIFGYNDKGELKEINLFQHKQGHAFREYLQVMSILCSKCLQYGVSPESLAKKLEGFVSTTAGFAEGENFNGYAHYVAFLLRKFAKKEEQDGKTKSFENTGTKE